MTASWIERATNALGLGTTHRERALPPSASIAAAPAAPAALSPPAPEPARRRRRASVAEVVVGIVEMARAEGLVGYPLLPHDIDELAGAWTAAAGLEAAPASLVREALAVHDAARRDRPRLSRSRPEHVALARRLRALGRPDDRATVFVIFPAAPQLVLNPNEAAAAPARPASGRSRLRIGVRAESATGAGAESAPPAVAASPARAVSETRTRPAA